MAELSALVRLEAVFRNELTATYADPTSITLYLLNPNGIETSFPWPGPYISRDSVGHFHITFTPSIAGIWQYKWQGSGAVIATSHDGSVTVNSSLLPIVLFDASTTRLTADNAIITADTF